MRLTAEELLQPIALGGFQGLRGLKSVASSSYLRAMATPAGSSALNIFCSESFERNSTTLQVTVLEIGRDRSKIIFLH